MQHIASCEGNHSTSIATIAWLCHGGVANYDSYSSYHVENISKEN